MNNERMQLTYLDVFNNLNAKNILASGVNANSGLFNSLDLNNIDVLSLSGVDINITNGNVSLTNRPTVNGTGVVLIGELNPVIVSTGSLLNNKINSLSGYVNSQDIVFSGQTFNTGSRLDNKINSLSGHINSQDIIFSGQVASTGSILDTKINSLSGLFVIYTGSLDVTFASDAQLFATGSTLDNKINSLSGYVNSQDIILSGQIASSGSRLDNKINSLSGNLTSTYATISNLTNTGSILDNKINSLSGWSASAGNLATTGSILISNINSLSGLFTTYTGNLDSTYASDAQLFSTCSILDNKINNLSGYVNSQDNIFSGQTFNTGSRLDSKINSLSGYVDSKSITLPTTIVYITGDQIISGNKTFINNIAVSGTGNFNSVKVSSIDKLFLSGIDMVVTGNSSINVYNAIYISGNPVLTGVDSSSYATVSNLFATGSTLDNKINSLSGYVNSQNIIFSGQTASTGSILNNKINNLSGYINSLSSNIVFTTGNQSIAGNKTLTSKLNITVSASNDSALKVGTLEFQPYSVNNAWLGDNTYYNAGFYRRSAGYAGAFYFQGPEGQFRFADTDNAGTTYTPAVQLKTHLDGRFGVGSNISTATDDFTNSNFFVDSTDNGSNVGLGTITPAEKLHVAGNLKLDGNNIYMYDSANGADNSLQWGDNELYFNNNYDGDFRKVGFFFNNGPLGENTLHSTQFQDAIGTRLYIPSGKTDYIALASEVVNMIGNQTISGIKTFTSRPTVNNTGILFSGEAAPKDIASPIINIVTNTISLDLSTFSYFLVNLNSNITTTNFNNPKAAPEVTNFVLQLSGDGTIRSVTWPTSLRWPGSAAPTITIGPNKVDTYSIFSYDGGVNYYGFPAGYNS